MTVRQPIRMCVRCERLTTDPVVVSEVHAGSGPGFNVYACADCAPHIPRPPDVLDLLANGLGDWRDEYEETRYQVDRSGGQGADSEKQPTEGAV